MTDPKLVEKASKLFHIREDGPDVAEIAMALQSHGDEVRRKTVEEAAQVADDEVLTWQTKMDEMKSEATVAKWGVGHCQNRLWEFQAMRDQAIKLATAIRKLLENNHA